MPSSIQPSYERFRDDVLKLCENEPTRFDTKSCPHTYPNGDSAYEGGFFCTCVCYAETMTYDRV
jgi:hypothetical protein